MLPLYVLAITCSALLLFVVQPMLAKMVLPRLGGSPAVWNTCMVFFQAVLLAGYAYAHWLTQALRPRLQVALHLALLAVALFFLPLAAGRELATSTGTAPALAVLGWLAVAAGIPVFALSTTSPLLQRWFVATGHGAARDPYFLYAASNAGSMVALLAYPVLLEPTLPLTAGSWSQMRLWSVGFVLVVLLSAACAWPLLRHRGRLAAEPGGDSEAPAIGWRRRGLWVLLAFVPSSTMLGATQLITSEIAAVPLLWIVPLALYLLTFIFAFSGRVWIPDRISGAALAILAIVVATTAPSDVRPPGALLLPLHLLALLAVGLVCHGRLAADRPPARRLTEFYFLLALGGVLGGAFNALVAPLLFDTILEYPLALAAACWLRPRDPATAAKRDRLLDLLLPVSVVLLIVALRGAPWLYGRAWGGLVGVGTAAILSLLLLRTPLRSGLAVALLAVTIWLVPRVQNPPLLEARTFFGIHRVMSLQGEPLDAVNPEGVTEVVRIPFHQLVHGTTRHGRQAWLEDLRRVPTGYYHPTGPFGAIFEAFAAGGAVRRMGVIGLGAGTLAAYGQDGMGIRFFEIDPQVVEIARDPRLFTYMSDSAASVDVVLGDGRRSLGHEPDGSIGLLVVDAFSSDSVPVHLITREAFELYLRKLEPGGLLAVHLSSQFLDLRRVVGALAADLGVAAWVQEDSVGTLAQVVEGKESSTWAALARTPEALTGLTKDPRWVVLSGAGSRRGDLWTDDFSNVLGVLRLRPPRP